MRKLAEAIETSIEDLDGLSKAVAERVERAETWFLHHLWRMTNATAHAVRFLFRFSWKTLRLFGRLSASLFVLMRIPWVGFLAWCAGIEIGSVWLGLAGAYLTVGALALTFVGLFSNSSRTQPERMAGGGRLVLGVVATLNVALLVFAWIWTANHEPKTPPFGWIGKVRMELGAERREQAHVVEPCGKTAESCEKPSALSAASTAGTTGTATTKSSVVSSGIEPYSWYTLRREDSFLRIATMYRLTIAEVLLANPELLADGGLERLMVGDKIRIPTVTRVGPEKARTTQKYTVGVGDTLWDIAKRFGTTTTAIRKASGLRSHDRLVAGMALTIP